MKSSIPSVSIISAMTRNRVIGRNNAMPWHLPADLQHFKAVTLGKPMIMGRLTWESLPGRLPGRPHIVLTRNLQYQAEGAQVVHSWAKALAAAGQAPEVMVVGGAELYAQALQSAQMLYLTLIDAEIEGDAYFPDFDAAAWRQAESVERAADERNPYDLRFVRLERLPIG